MPRANKGAFVQPGQGFGVAAAAVFFLNQGKQAAGWKSRASLIGKNLGRMHATQEMLHASLLLAQKKKAQEKGLHLETANRPSECRKHPRVVEIQAPLAFSQ